MMDETGYIISPAIEGTKRGLTKLKEYKRQVDKYKSFADTEKAIKDRLVKEMEVAKKTLKDLLKEELANQAEPAEDETKDKVIWDTIR